MSGRIISLCDLTGNAVRPWAEAGYTCVCYDTGHSIRRDRIEKVGAGSIRYRWGDVRALTPPEFGEPVRFVFAFPPCTHLAVSGARDFARKGLRLLIDGLEIVESCRMLCEWMGVPYLLENPVGRLSTMWRRPDFTFDPCDFAGYLEDPGSEAYTKKTCLWTGGGFAMPEPRRVVPFLGSYIHTLPPARDRAEKRSVTPRGFARAVFEMNSPLIVKATNVDLLR